MTTLPAFPTRPTFPTFQEWFDATYPPASYPAPVPVIEMSILEQAYESLIVATYGWDDFRAR